MCWLRLSRRLVLLLLLLLLLLRRCCGCGRRRDWRRLCVSGCGEVVLRGGIARTHRYVHKLARRLQVEGLTLLGENKRRDGVYVLLLHALYLHLSLELRQAVHGEIAQIAQTREAMFAVLGIGAARVAVVADAANARSLHRRQLELAHGLERGQLKHFELLLAANDHFVVLLGLKAAFLTENKKRKREKIILCLKKNRVLTQEGQRV